MLGDIGTGSFCLTFEGTKRTGPIVPIITGGSMEYKYLENQRILIFRITEEIDEFKAKELRRKADYEIERFMPKRVIFDFNRVSFMDSSGIGMIIGRYKQTSMLGGKMELTNLRPAVRKIFEMSGVLRLIPEIDLEQEELSELQQNFI